MYSARPIPQTRCRGCCISKPLSQYTGVEGWYKNGENWQYKKADARMEQGCWSG